MTRRTLYHGGTTGMNVGQTIRPNHARKGHDGCHICAARNAGLAVQGDHPTPEGWVYATRELVYARFYAALSAGDVYRVELRGDVERSAEDRFPSWRARRAKVTTVVERSVSMTWPQRRDLFRKWGGTDAEFSAMVRSMGLHEASR